MKKLLFIAEHFPPPQHSGTLRSSAFVKHLPSFGIHPVVLTSADAKTRAIKRGLDCNDARSDCEGAAVIERVSWHLPEEQECIFNSSFARRLPGLSTWGLRRRRGEMLNRLANVAGKLVQSHGCEAIYATSNPPEGLLLAQRVSQECGIPYVVDLRDPWSYQPSIPYRHYLDFLLERRLEKNVLSRAAAVIVTAKALAELLNRELNVPNFKTVVIENGFNDEDFDGIEIHDSNNSVFTIVHAGQLTAAGATHGGNMRQTIKSFFGFDFQPLHSDYATRSADVVCEAMFTLLKAYPALAEELEVQLVGCDPSEIAPILERYGHTMCIRAISRVDAKSAATICANADLLLLLQTATYLRKEDFCVAIAAKLYTYLKTGRRILVSSQGHEMAELVANYGAGRQVSVGDVRQIAAAIKDEFDIWNDSSTSTTQLRDLPELSRFTRTERLAATLHKVFGGNITVN